MGDDEAGQQQPPPPEIIGDGGVREVRVNVIADDNDGYLSPAGNMSPSLSFRWKTKYRLWRVPEQVRAINKEEAYAPKFVSIGPYHRYAGDDVHGGGDRNRLRGEKLKKRYLHELLKDVGPSDDGILQRCTRSLLEIADEVRWFYAEEYVRDMKDEEIVRMLLHDGCFIIKHLYNFAMGYNEEELHATRWAPAQLRIDLALLENQIPFFVLEKIFHHLTPRSLMPKIKRGVVGHDDETMRQRKRHTLLVMAMWYMLKGWFSLPEDESDKLYKLIADEEVHHLLHLLHLAHAHLVKVDDDKAVLREHSGSATERQLQGQGYIDDDDAKAKANIVSAAQLRGLGVKIKKVPTKRGGILDVRLRDGLVTPVLEVPALTVEQATVQLLQNLVAYEQQGTLGNVDEPRDYFTTYAFLMYNLVSSTDDIAVLQEKGVLLNNFGSHETIIEYFKNLCRGNQRSGTEETPIGKVLQGLRACSQNKAYRYWAEAKKYMDSPVKILALIVSTLLAVSTVLQTTTAFYPK